MADFKIELRQDDASYPRPLTDLPTALIGVDT